MIKSFEEICTVDAQWLKKQLLNFKTEDIVKACMGASPTVNEFMSGIYFDVDFTNIREKIGAVKVDEVERIQKRIVDAVNRHH